ncbi:hypothetical protein DPMN_153076 [Dreissena polymorpha]|uniref:Uncharacterized protein n=1 Tax=Dreissena polymorpha TaxID=45954 RepID=A0A9D4FLL7_DREPO|nr:hypothetical protein DPMN_153076 [Dreissena polymorpha]
MPRGQEAHVTFEIILKSFSKFDKISSNELTRKNVPTPGGHVFYDDGTINVTCIVLTRFNKRHVNDKCINPCDHVYQRIGTIFRLIQDIIRTNVLTKYHQDRTENVAYRVFYYRNKWENAQLPGGYAFQLTRTIFDIVQDIIRTNLLTKFHEDRTINVAIRVLTRQMFETHYARQMTDIRRSQKSTLFLLR